LKLKRSDIKPAEVEDIFFAVHYKLSEQLQAQNDRSLFEVNVSYIIVDRDVDQSYQKHIGQMGKGERKKSLECRKNV
jgi:hypothetical protein